MASAQSVDDTPIFFNGIIYTGNSVTATIEAVAIRGDKILAVGTLDAVQKRAGKSARMMDLKGGCLMPGIIDSHNHAISGGRSLLVANLGDTLLAPESLARYAQKSIVNGRGLRRDVLYIQGMHSASWNDATSLHRIFDGVEFGGRGVFH
ncbi:MAG TPA: hypothetical protein VK658_11210 [Chryseolinea sp.]|nr:hypothetical protein [Chryseolinea sp.]